MAEQVARVEVKPGLAAIQPGSFERSLEVL